MQITNGVERWNTSTLVQLVPGTTAKLWLTRWIPALVAARVLRKIGKAWVGRRAAIESALLDGLVGCKA